MLKGARLSLTAILLLTLAACAAPWSQEKKHTAAPISSPPASGDSTEGAGALPPPKELSPEEPRPKEEVILLPEETTPGSEEVDVEVIRDGDTLVVKETIRAPDDSDWLSSAANDEQRRLDMEACYDYSRAQVRRDEEIYVDQNAGWSNINNDSRYSFLQQQQAGYGFKKRKKRLFSSCMESKGYSKN